MKTLIIEIRRPAIVLGLVVTLFAGVALAAAYSGSLAAKWETPVYAKGGIFIGNGTPAVSTNKLSKVIPCPAAAYDFASTIPRPGFIQQTPKHTCAGVLPGDTCTAGVMKAAPEDGGSAWEDNVMFDCIARGVDQVSWVMQTLSGDGGVTDPPDAGLNCTCFSNR